jgi:ApbE superfamily uncharacterized protein (UPF0280 family)
MMPTSAVHAAMLPDGRRLHLSDGPIDLIVEAFGDDKAVREAYRCAFDRLDGLLAKLCQELDTLRQPVTSDVCPLAGVVARRMWEAVKPFADEGFLTPMAAVAGAVAEEVLTALMRPGVVKGYVNNGGDIAVHLTPGEQFAVGLVNRPDRPLLVGTATLFAGDNIRGVATSGRHGRSFSLGIADAVTILAETAAMADAAATVIANAVDLPSHPNIVRVPAREVQADSDLGAIRVTRSVPDLSSREAAEALDRGLARAEFWRGRGLIAAAALHLQGESRSIDKVDGVSLLRRRPLDPVSLSDSRLE